MLRVCTAAKFSFAALFQRIENKINNVKDETDKKELDMYIKKYCKFFNADYDTIMAKPFKKLVPASSRPYANLYTPN